MITGFGGKIPQNRGAAFVAENATLVGDVTLEEGATVWYGAVLRADEPQNSGARKLLAYLQGQDFAAAMTQEGFFPVL